MEKEWSLKFGSVVPYVHFDGWGWHWELIVCREGGLDSCGNCCIWLRGPVDGLLCFAFSSSRPILRITEVGIEFLSCFQLG